MSEFRAQVRAHLVRYLEDDNITPKSLERLMARMLSITMQEHGAEVAAAGIRHGMNWLHSELRRRSRR